MRWNGIRCACLFIAATLLYGCSTIKPPDDAHPIERTLVTTGYCKCQKCTEWQGAWYGDPVYSSGPNKGKRKQVGITASGARAGVGTIAADTSRYPFDTIMHIPGYGYGRVEDRGGEIKGGHIDLFFRTHKQALKWGRQEKEVKIWLPSDD